MASSEALSLSSCVSALTDVNTGNRSGTTARGGPSAFVAAVTQVGRAGERTDMR